MSKYSDHYTQASSLLRFRGGIGDRVRFSDANELLHKLTLKGMEDAIPLFCELCRSYKDKFPEDLEEDDFRSYLERQTLNFMQAAVEITLPGFTEPRAMAWLLDDIRMKGFTKDVETYLRAHDGLKMALARAISNLNSNTSWNNFAEEGDFS